MDVSSEAARFLPLVRSIATQMHDEIAPQIGTDQILGWATAALNDAFLQYRSRQGSTLRTYLTYRIRAAVFSALTRNTWPSASAEKRYRFAKKSNELLLHFTTSAEGAVVRSTRREEEEMMHLLRFLVIAGLLIWENVPRGEIQRQWALAIDDLDDRQRRFLYEYYDQDASLEAASGLAGSEAFRFHLRILEKLEARLRSIFD